MDKRSKYSLFPAKPSPPPREPLPPLPEGSSISEPREQSPHLQEQESPTIPPQELFLPPSRHRQPPASQNARSLNPQEPLTPPAEEPSSPWPPLNNSWSPREETTSTLNEIPTSTDDTSSKRKMHQKLHSPSSSTSTSSSESSLHKPTDTSTPPPPLNPRVRNRPRTVYFHSGIGGAGNYHKAIREDNVLHPVSRDRDRSNQPRFLSSLFDTLGGKKGRRQQRHYGTGDESGSAGSSGETLPLGAAEVMRRKMLGFALDGKTKENGARS